MKVGFVGLGAMGLPMAGSLLRSGFELYVYNRTGSKAEPLLARGARRCDSPAQLTRIVEVVLSCLADAAADRDVLLSETGVVASARPGQILVDHATVDLETTRVLHAACRDRGAAFLDAPVSGGPVGAAAATLSIMVGGAQDTFDAVRPVLEAMGQRVVRTGGPGCGTITKLLNQMLVGIHTLAACEAIRLAKATGLEPELAVDLLMTAWGQSKMLERTANRLADDALCPSAVPLRLLAKDLEFVVRLADAEQVQLPATRVAHRIVKIALEHGMAEHDIAALFHLAENETS